MLEMLGDWGDAPAVILSCPGPLRRHDAAILPTGGLALPQVLLGAESQLLAFAAHALAGHAAAEHAAARLVYAPFPEMFNGPGSLADALHGLDAEGAVHLRFGSVRGARVLKGARNACVLAEVAGPAPLTVSHHPFASGTVLPAAMQRVFALCPGTVRPSTIGGQLLDIAELPAALIRANLQPNKADPNAANVPPGRAGLTLNDGKAGLVQSAGKASPTQKAGKAGPTQKAGKAGLDIARLDQFRSQAWATGHTKPVRPEAAEAGCVLVPWNMDHPGSIVPDLIERLVRLDGTAARLPRLVLLPFNYIGQTGIIRDLITRLRMATDPPGAALPALFIARVRDLSGIAPLRRISRTAWVDGNDPESWWTIGRLGACGIATLLLDPGDAPRLGPRPTGRLQADESVWVEAETRCGALMFPGRLPSLREIPTLLEITAELQARPRPGPRPEASPDARPAQAANPGDRKAAPRPTRRNRLPA